MVSAASEAFAQMIIDRVEQGFTPYILTFMFKPLPGNSFTRPHQMRGLVTSAYEFYLPFVTRRPRTPAFSPWLPMWILTLDLPVPKREKQILRHVSINDGQHYGGMAVEPPFRRNRQTLAEHFAERQSVYRDRFPGIEEIDAKPITHDIENVSDYTFKWLHREHARADRGRRRTSDDDILVLPKSGSEVRPERLSERKRSEK